ncbi:MAG: hypothetical protein Q7T37_00330 [bacterium]|nr:hypothetical protein [bacterium]MDO8742518.1 hypothetical protein [bacterium]
MNPLIVLVAVALVVAVTIVVAVLVYLRNKKKRERGRTQSPAKSVTDSSKKSETILELIRGKINTGSKVFWNIATIITMIALFFYLGTDSKIDPADVGIQTWNHWIQILIVWGVVAFLIWLNIEEEKKASKLYKMCVWTVAVLLIVLPMWAWITSPSQSSGVRASTQKTRCMMPFTGNAFADHPAFGPDGGYSSRDKWLPLRIRPGENSCLVENPKGSVENPKGGHIEWDSEEPSIHDLEVSCLYERGGTGSIRTDGCRGGVVIAGFVRNPTDTPVTVWYAYAKNKPSI